ncbi:MAG: Hydroxypyruvate isomerase [Rhodoglobus sp.]|nr:Hydroxypyruvate isomerase [Rhodoglobus sp.]
MSGSPRFAANCSFLFTEHALLDRPAAAKAAGFDAIEFWWPFEKAVPDDRDVAAFVSAVENAGVSLVGLNFFAGDLAGPDCGVLSMPGHVQEFLDNVDAAVGIGEHLHVEVFNALYGNRDERSIPSEQADIAVSSLSIAAATAARIGATVVVEAVSGPKPYPLRSAADAVAVVDRVRAHGTSNIGFLCDIYHLAANGEDPVAAILTYGDTIAHVQLADLPGRGEPGTGELDIAGCLAALDTVGYAGWVGLEYIPRAGTVEGLGWLDSVPHRTPRAAARANLRKEQ